ncbi:50S ribosomal protein L3 N(5)-glutamine methyltransferase [Wenzhouxiangella sp. AB-CW3]|uniref:50S ribosomal protein L3 N(5)-glutamine methyltransferase n=1 Tax=Wenzhouxiangella sp. AB-CW3 TaxID=2771012 RepID=UPI00168BACB5|nr:50S ribosomal protein L3 N(5)-glutamine methyltransferase [Wenzhouxiangella sp. AB-CW3]QOC23426.1 50S ribosomal protein L3 N(5)-glutamine methyltransferase [Wenzhouxiangella sp. AB-CW3]
MKLIDHIHQHVAEMEAAGLHFGHGTDNAFDEACWMASATLGLAPDFDESVFQRELASAEENRLRDLVAERIATRKPLAYLLGEAWFCGMAFEVNEDVLVPRSPLAELIVEGFAPWMEPGRLRRVVDVGTGSGCLAIAVAKRWPEATVDAVDISPEALKLARRNAERHDVSERVDCIESDLLEGLGERRYDVILANPPYVPTASMADLPEEYRHEPVLGLEAGDDGLDLVRHLLDQASDHLEPGGILVCEVGEAAEAADRLLAERKIEATWLDFEHGGEGVFLVSPTRP